MSNLLPLGCGKAQITRESVGQVYHHATSTRHPSRVKSISTRLFSSTLFSCSVLFILFTCEMTTRHASDDQSDSSRVWSMQISTSALSMYASITGHPRLPSRANPRLILGLPCCVDC
jgi:hypothetical protein